MSRVAFEALEARDVDATRNTACVLIRIQEHLVQLTYTHMWSMSTVCTYSNVFALVYVRLFTLFCLLFSLASFWLRLPVFHLHFHFSRFSKFSACQMIKIPGVLSMKRWVCVFFILYSVLISCLSDINCFIIYIFFRQAHFKVMNLLYTIHIPFASLEMTNF